MKKFILPLLLLLAIGMLVAVESAPSEVVGYFKIDVPVNSWTPVSIPFQITNGTALNVFGNNWASSDDYTVADQIVDANNGTTTSYYTGFFWDNEDPAFALPGHIYWINRTQPAVSADMFLLGKVDPQGFTLVMSGQNLGGWSPFAINDAAGIDPNTLGFTVTNPDWDNGYYDKIVCANDGRTAEYWGVDFNGWNATDGLPFLIEPTKAYYYYSNQAANWNWTFVPTRGSVVPLSNGFIRSSK